MSIGNKEYEFIDSSFAGLPFFVYPNPRGSEEPEPCEAKINLLHFIYDSRLSFFLKKKCRNFKTDSLSWLLKEFRNLSVINFNNN